MAEKPKQNPPVTPEAALPSHFRYVKILGAGLIVLGILVLAVAFGQVAWNSMRGAQRVRLPGSKTVSLAQPGIYLAIYDVPEKNPVPPELLAQLDVMISDFDTARQMPVQPLVGAQVAYMGGRRGHVLFQTEVPEAGRYLLTAAYRSGKGRSFTALLIHESIQNVRSDLAAGLVVCLVLAGFGIYLLISNQRQIRKFQEQNHSRTKSPGPKKK